MGNILEPKIFKTVEEFQFHEPLLDDNSNGLYFNNIYIPEEVVFKVLTFLSPKEALKYTLVCRKWCNIIKSDLYWRELMRLNSDEKPGDFPWYVYYCYLTTNNFKNLMQNGNGANQFKHWELMQNGGNGIVVEREPIGCDPLPKEPEFETSKSCFATSFGYGTMQQVIDLTNKRLLRYILKQFNLPICASDWTAGRFDCTSIFNIMVRLISNDTSGNPMISEKGESVLLLDPDRTQWRKVELIITDYPKNIIKIEFIQQGKDKQFWAGNYGAKMSGAVVKILLHKP